MPPEISTETQDYFETSPLTSDIGKTPTAEISARITKVNLLAENLRDALDSEETSKFLRQLIEQRLQLPRPVTRNVADHLRDILLGERDSSTLRTDLEERAGVPASASEEITALLTKKFITPNYFQISKLRGKASGSQNKGSAAEENVAVPRPVQPKVTDEEVALPPPPMKKNEDLKKMARKMVLDSPRSAVTPEQESGEILRSTQDDTPPPVPPAVPRRSAPPEPPRPTKNVIDLRGSHGPIPGKGISEKN